MSNNDSFLSFQRDPERVDQSCKKTTQAYDMLPTSWRDETKSCDTCGRLTQTADDFVFLSGSLGKPPWSNQPITYSRSEESIGGRPATGNKTRSIGVKSLVLLFK